MGAGASTFIWRYADIQYGFLDQELGFDALHALAAQGRHRTVRSLLQKGMDPNARRLEGAFGADNDERGDSPMICTARGALGKKDRPQHVKTLEVLLHFGANINQANVMNHTPLYVACERNLLLVATWLLQHGADVNINCKTGTSPLMCAYENQNTALATLLLEKGAIVIRPAPTFSQIKFPELADELETIETPTTNKDHTALHSALQGYIDQEAERRSRLSADANEAQRLEDQRVYREQLAKEGAKRKARRRRQREEAQQQRRLPSVHAIGTATNSTESENDSNLLSSMLGGDHTNNGEGLLLWEKKAVVLRTRSVTSDRPSWVARQIYCTQDFSAHRRESDHAFMHQCEKLYNSLEQDRSRHTNARSISTAPPDLSRVGLCSFPCNVRPETASF